METRKRISRSVLSAIAFFGTLGILSVGYSAYSGLSAVTPETPLTVALWTQVKDNFDDLNSRVSNFSFVGGKVGIGTAGPAQKLEVTGNVLVGRHNGSAFSRLIGIGASSGDMITGTSGGSYVEFENSGTPNDDSIHFITHKGGVSHARRMTIDPIGNVGIGTTAPSSKLHVNGVITADNVNQAPIISPSRAAYYTSSAAGWQNAGFSATVTVPPGPNRKYRVTMKAMAYGAAGNYMLTTVSKSNTSITGTPTGMGTIYEYATDTGWHTIFQEGFVDLAPGTHTYYLWAYGGGSYTVNYHNDAGLTNIIIWPM